ncbi:MAG TPA: YgaP-like transmembrane domain [Thermoanaerobaculia bacterium]
MAFAKFMASPVGRGIRIVAAIALIGWGFGQGTTPGTAAGVFGIVALAAGALNGCVIGPLFGAPFKGKDALKS